MTDLQEKAMRMALEALDCLPWQASPIAREAAQALRTALSQPEQEPYGWISNEDGWFRKHEIADLTFKNDAIPLYTAPSSTEAAVLAEREACAKVCETMEWPHGYECAAAIRAKGEA